MKFLNRRLVWGATLFSTPGMKPSSGHYPLVLSVVILVGLLAVCFGLRLRGSNRQPPDNDPPDGWGRRSPEPPPNEPSGPRGGIPIPLGDAVPSRVRLRGSSRLGETFRGRSRRPARDPKPERRPVRFR